MAKSLTQLSLLQKWAIVVALALVLSFLFSSDGRETSMAHEPTESFDTHIPHGFVLVPILISNYEALDSILGHKGVVDLYIRPPASTKVQPVVRGIQILRAPHSDSHFAVLAPEQHATKILRHEGPYFVAVQAPGAVGTDFVEPATSIRPGPTIIIEEDESSL